MLGLNDLECLITKSVEMSISVHIGGRYVLLGFRPGFPNTSMTDNVMIKSHMSTNYQGSCERASLGIVIYSLVLLN